MIRQDLPIYHLTPVSYYERQPKDQPFQTETLVEEGFIHCTAGVEKLVETANLYFANLQDKLLALEIDPSHLTAPLIFEPAMPPLHSTGRVRKRQTEQPEVLFPHIYGPLDRQAIVKRITLQRDLAGRWQMPD